MLCGSSHGPINLIVCVGPAQECRGVACFVQQQLTVAHTAEVGSHCDLLDQGLKFGGANGYKH